MNEARVTKRIAITVPREMFNYRGIGAYTCSILDWALERGYVCDIISDEAPRNNGLFDRYRGRVQWITPEQTYSYKTWTELTLFQGVYNPERALNFRNALHRALKAHAYDLFICNWGEDLTAVTGLGLHLLTTVIHPTHHESQAGYPLNNDWLGQGPADVYRALCSIPDVVVAPQTDVTRTQALTYLSHKADRVVTIPLFVPERRLLNFDTIPQERWGVGYIGTHEERKNPDAYYEVLKATGLPAVVITPTTKSAQKFENKFKELGIEYKIHVAVVGEEKARIIQSMAAGFSGAYSETFGLGVLEMAHSAPTVLFEEHTWSHAHRDYCHVVPKADAARTLLDLYGKPTPTSTRETLEKRDQSIGGIIDRFMSPEQITRIPKNNLYKMIAEQGIVDQSEWAKTLPSHPIDEIQKTQRMVRSTAVEVLQTYDKTYYRLPGSNLSPQETKQDTPLFTFE